MVIGDIQKVVLWTHVIQPNDELPLNKQIPANYFMQLTKLNGEPATLLQFKHKTIFMNFWASWCPPCRAEMPTIQNLYDKIKDKNIVFLMISLDEDRAKATNFIKDEGFTFPVYFINGSIPGEYGTTTIPTTFVISPSGKIVFKETGMANYNSENFIEMLHKLSGSKP